MRRVRNRVSAAAALLAAGFGPSAWAAAPAPDGAPRSGVEPGNSDPAVRPQDDFFRHVNGAWLARTTIPAERALYGSFVQLADQAEADLRKIIETAADDPATPAGSEAKKFGDLYAAFLDEARADALGLAPLRGDLDAINAAADLPGFFRVLAAQERRGVDGLFNSGVNTDAKQSDRYIVYILQGGLGLPDESYYRDPQFAKVREAYLAHVEKMLALAGVADPKGSASKVMALETRLAKGHWDRVRSRDRTQTYNKFGRKALESLAPGLPWSAWFEAIGPAASGVAEVVVAQPSYLTDLAKALGEVPLDEWKLWLTWHALNAQAHLLSKPFVDEDFDFNGRTLTGATEDKPRWKRGVALVGANLGEAVGKVYVAQRFPPAAKGRMDGLVKNLTDAYRENIQVLDWMSPPTRAKALEKLAKFHPKIGYPARWRDYSELEVRRDDLVGGVARAHAFELDRDLGKLGRPVDHDEWFMTPQTVNAYYNPGLNEIVFPAAILRPPFFDLGADDAVNYGGIGAVIGHEIGHGFDDQGAKSDGDGNMVDWWTESDLKEFQARTKLLTEQYDAFSPAQLPDKHVNGALTIGENIGDLGGLSIAYKAYRRSLGGAEAPVIDGLTGDQRFFIGWAQVWRSKYREAELARRLAIDPHSPTEFRCNGVVRNLPEFYAAFGVKPGDKLWLPPERRVRIW